MGTGQDLRRLVSDINLFRYGKGIINLDLCMPEQELHGSQITGTPVDQGRLSPSATASPMEFRSMC